MIYIVYFTGGHLELIEIKFIKEIDPEIKIKIKNWVEQINTNFLKHHPLRKFGLRTGVAKALPWLWALIFTIPLAIIFSAIKNNTNKKLTDFLIKNNLQPIKLYQWVANKEFKDLELHQLQPDFTFPLTAKGMVLEPTTVIAGSYKHDYHFELGARFRRVRTRNGYSFFWYRFFSCQINRTDVNTVIKPETAISEMLSKNSYKLESLKFEKLFKLDYDQPIKLRKLLTPKVMNNLLKVVKINQSNDLKLPVIKINNNQLTFQWKRNSTYNSTDNFKEVIALQLFSYHRNLDRIAEHACKKLLIDFHHISMAMLWAINFDQFKIKN